MQLRVVFLGTSSATPTFNRGLTSTAVVRGGELLIFDAGEGMQRNFLKSGIGINRKTKVFITHMHSDHCIGLLGLLQTMSLQNRDMPMEIYGPEEIKEFIDVNKKLLRFGLTFPLTVYSVSNGMNIEERDYIVKVREAKHSIKSYSYCIEERDRPGMFYPDKARALGVPEGRLWHRLQHGEDIELNGKKIRSKDVTGPVRRGRKIGISGDTRPDDDMIEFFRNCDLLIFDSTYSDEHKEKADENMHSTSREAATIAKKASVKKLVLSHFSARYDDVNVLVNQALEVHPNVVAAEDLMSLEIPYDQ